MDNIQEREESKFERSISIGKDFQLFDPRHLKQFRVEDDTFDQFNSRIILDIGKGFKIPFYTEAAALVNVSLSNKKIEFLLPFGPGEGYPIDSADFNLKERLEKVDRLAGELGKPIDLENPLALSIETPLGFELNKLGLTKRTKPGEYEFPPEILDLVIRLRILIVAPKGIFEARTDPDYFDVGTVEFNYFYPADSGPLANSPEHKLFEGFDLALPSDLEKLSQIRARFVLVDEQPKGSI